MNPVEQAAVELAIRYERAQGRSVTYVGDGWPPGLGGEVMEWGRSKGYPAVRPTCDLVSRTPDGKLARVIEVKGKGSGQSSVPIVERQRLAMNALGADWWLYVVLNCDTNPQLIVVRDPRRLPWRLITKAAELPAGQYRRVGQEARWGVLPNEVRASGDAVDV